MSILFTEYNEETAKRVYAEEYAEERVEDTKEDIAMKMLQDDEPLEKIMKYTGLTHKEVKRLQLTPVEG